MDKQIDGKIFRSLNDIFEERNSEVLRLNSIYDFEKINSLFKNFDTMSFLDLIFN